MASISQYIFLKGETRKMENKILLPEGITLGNVQNDKTGVSVILAKNGAVGGVSVRGCAPGTRETDVLSAEKAVEVVNAVVLSGGSAFGLDASAGVMTFLKEQKCGFNAGGILVPIVSSAVIFDLDESYTFPTAAMGYEAAKNAKNEVAKLGRVGVGTGASVGKIRGRKYSSRGGFGGSTVNSGEAFVTALVAVNAVGDIYDHKTGDIIAGAKDNNGDFLNTVECVLTGNFKKLLYGVNTTLCCLVTNVKLSKLQCNKLASIAHNGYAQSIKPVHTDSDGDTIFCLSKGEIEMDFTMLSVMAVEAVSRAITNAVTGKKGE